MLLGIGKTVAPPQPTPPDVQFLSPTFVETLAAELSTDVLLSPIFRNAVAALGTLVDLHGSPMVDPALTPKGGTIVVRCGLMYRRGQGEADRHCIPASDGLRAQVLRQCHDGPLGRHFDRVAGAAPRLPVGQDVDVAESTSCLAECTPCPRSRRRRRRTRRRSIAICASAPAPVFPMCSWWITTPSSRATYFAPSPRAWARA